MVPSRWKATTMSVGCTPDLCTSLSRKARTILIGTCELAGGPSTTFPMETSVLSADVAIRTMQSGRLIIRMIFRRFVNDQYWHWVKLILALGAIAVRGGNHRPPSGPIGLDRCRSSLGCCSFRYRSKWCCGRSRRHGPRSRASGACPTAVACVQIIIRVSPRWLTWSVAARGEAHSWCAPVTAHGSRQDANLCSPIASR